MINNTGAVYKRRQRILKALTAEPVGIKRLAKQLNISNTLFKKDVDELVIQRKISKVKLGKVSCVCLL